MTTSFMAYNSLLRKRCWQSLSSFLIIVLLTLSITKATALASVLPPAYSELKVSAKAALIAEVKNNNDFTVLWQKEAYQRLPIASTTKILTALLVLKKAQLNEVVIVPRAAELVGGNKLGLKAGERRSVKELLYALLLNSANDAAVTLATYISGSEPAFAESMNTLAQTVGAYSSNFINSHGLAPGSRHYSTAYDLFLITKEALKFKQFKKIVATRKTFWLTSHGERKVLENSNQLLTIYPYATGVKTGYTAESGYCLVATAEKEGRLQVAVILGAPNREASFLDAQQLFNFAFQRFKLRKIVQKGKVYSYYRQNGEKIPLKASKNVTALVYTGQDKPLVYKKVFLKKAKAGSNKISAGYLIVQQFNQEKAKVLLVGTKNMPFLGLQVFKQRLKWLVKQVVNLFK